MFATITFLVKLKKTTKAKHKQWVKDQMEYTECLNWCVQELLHGEKLSSKDIPFQLKSCIKNEAIRRARKKVSEYWRDPSNKLPEFKSHQPISINNQNWETKCKNGKWYIGFTSSAH